MRIKLWLFSLFLGFFSFLSGEALFRSELIFPLQEKHVHSSTIVETPGGDILACWFHGSGERTAPDVVLQGSRLKKGSREWSPVFPMADTPNIPDCNPVLYIDPQGELWLFWIAVPADRWEDSLLRFRKSRDFEGEGPPKWYWQDLLLLKPGQKFVTALEAGFSRVENLPGYGAKTPQEQRKILNMAGNLSLRQRGWMPRTHIIQLSSGRILFPLYSDGFMVGIMAISDDNAHSWRLGSPIPGLGLNQPAVAERKDGTLVAYLRDEGPPPKRILYSESRDQGETWSPAIDLEIPNPNTSLEVLVLKDGRWVMVFNDIERGRYQLSIALSEDEGDSWKWKRVLDKSEGGKFHYPFIFQGADGLLHISYTYQPGENTGKSIKHVTLDTEWIVEEVPGS